ncbi:MAG: tryptophan synthase subunit alpha [Gammaproteobacteria bacterium]|nr:MAG: tryptophan synthase subunit alpha [Gammaproteobacteria bacterium]
MSNRYQFLFKQLKQKNERAFVPFVTLCDPNYDLSLKIVRTLIESGADALELGLPFSDPVADGLVIQQASIRALKSGASIDNCFRLIETIRKEYPDIPIGLLVYSNLVVCNSIESFYLKAKNAGVDSVLIADVPFLESQPFTNEANKLGIQPIFLAPPNASKKLLKSIASEAKGYIYLLSRAGVTGTDVSVEMPITNVLKQLSDYNAPPSLLGFGISNTNQVEEAIKSDIGGVISGSAVVSIIAKNLENESKLIEQLGEFIADMKQATR